MLWQASIFTHEDKKEPDSDKTYTAYQIVVQDESHSWSVERRYSEFVDLHVKLKEKLPNQTLPSLPPKSYLNFGSPDIKKNNRRIALEKYLKQLLDSESPTSKVGEVLTFLDPEHKSGVNTAPAPAKEQAPLELLPLIPSNIFSLIPETFSLSNGEDCFPLLLLDHISESIKYLVAIRNQIGVSPSISTKISLFEVEKEKIAATVTSLTQQQGIITQLQQHASSKKESALQTEAASYLNTDPRIYSNGNPAPNPYYATRPENVYYPQNGPLFVVQSGRAYPGAYVNPPPIQQPRSPYYSPDMSRNFAGSVTVSSNNGYIPGGYQPPVYRSSYGPPVPPQQSSRDWDTLARYMETCLTHIQMALIWESSFAEYITAQDESTLSWCEVEERIKWFEGETDKLVIGSLGIALDKETRLAARKKMKTLRQQAKKI